MIFTVTRDMTPDEFIQHHSLSLRTVEATKKYLSMQNCWDENKDTEIIFEIACAESVLTRLDLLNFYFSLLKKKYPNQIKDLTVLDCEEMDSAIIRKLHQQRNTILATIKKTEEILDCLDSQSYYIETELWESRYNGDIDIIYWSVYEEQNLKDNLTDINEKISSVSRELCEYKAVETLLSAVLLMHNLTYNDFFQNFIFNRNDLQFLKNELHIIKNLKPNFKKEFKYILPDSNWHDVDAIS